MKKITSYIVLLITATVFLFAGFFICANFNINPFGGVHGEGSSDTVYTVKTVTVEIPSVTAPVLHGKPLNPTQKISLNRSRVSPNSEIYVNKDSADVAIIDSVCPPFAIDTSLAWKLTHRLVLWDTTYTSLDSGFYKISFTVDPAFRRVIDFSLSSTPLHPVIVEKQITNTIKIKSLWRLGIFTEYDLLHKGFVVGLRGTVALGAINFYGAPYYDGNKVYAPLGAEGLIFEN